MDNSLSDLEHTIAYAREIAKTLRAELPTDADVQEAADVLEEIAALMDGVLRRDLAKG